MTLSRLSPEDRVLLRGDRDPRSRSTVGGLAVLDSTPDWTLVRTRIDRASRSVPALRSRPVEPSFATTEPRWVIDPDFVLDRHVRHIALAAPGDRAALLELAERFFAEPFDPAAPLWRVLCVDGVGHGGAILTAASPLLRVEEVPVDLLDIALDSRHDSADLAPIPVPTDLEPADLAREGVRELPWRAAGLAVSGVHEVGSLAIHAVTDWRGAVDRAAGLVTPPVAVQGSALLAGRGTERAIILRSYPRSRADGAPTHRGGQRAHIAAIREALIAYHAESGLPLTSLGITAASHPAVLRRALAPSQDRVQSLGRLLPLLPTGFVDVVARPTRGADVAVSHVVAAAGSVGKATVVERYAVGPVPGNALTSVAVTTPERLDVAVRYDPEAIRDVALLERCLDAAFEQVLAPAPSAPRAARKATAKTAPAAQRTPSARKSTASKTPSSKTPASKKTTVSKKRTVSKKATAKKAPARKGAGA